MLLAISFPTDSPNVQIINSTAAAIISQSETELAARGHLDRLAQGNELELGVN